MSRPQRRQNKPHFVGRSFSDKVGLSALRKRLIIRYNAV